jgi:outer membrane receptor protein involved in Fe transport
VVNASADVPLDALRDGWSSRVALTLEVRNLLDAHYESVVGFPGRGRVVMVGVRVE